MPWTAAEAEKHNSKANTPKKQHQWAVVANAALKKYKSEGKAIATANSAIGGDAAYKGFLDAVVWETYCWDREFSAEQRKKAAESGAAMPGGGFPIKNEKDLKNAIQAIGRAKNRAATIKHIKSRARSLGLSKLVPEKWGTDSGNLRVPIRGPNGSRIFEWEEEDDPEDLMERLRSGDLDEDDYDEDALSVVVGGTVDSTITLFDTIELDAAARVRVTSDGYLAAAPRIARTGVQLYHGDECGRPDLDVVRVYRPETAVFSQDAMHSYAHRPVTLEHPPERVTADNWRKYSVGQTGDEPIRDGGSVRVPMVLMDSAAIKAFKDGKNQLSVGYTCDLDWESGTTADGEEYDAVQRDIRANHLAVVAAARGGPTLKIGDDDRNKETDTMNLKNVTIDGIEVQMTDTAAQVVMKAISTLNDKLAVMQKTFDAFKKKAEDEEEEEETETKKKDDALKAKDAEIATLKSQLKDAELTPEKLDAMVADRQSVIDKALKILAKDKPQIKGKTIADVRRQVVNSKLGDVAKDWDDNMIAASFNTLTAGIKSDPVDHARSAFGHTQPLVGQDSVDPKNKAYADYDKSLQDAWRSPAPVATQ